MEPSSSNIKKNSYIFSNKTLLFSRQARKVKEIHPEKISYTSGNRNPDNFFQEMETLKKLLIFQEVTCKA